VRRKHHLGSRIEVDRSWPNIVVLLFLDVYDYFADLAVLEEDDPCSSNCNCTGCIQAAAHEVDVPYEDSDEEDVPTGTESTEDHFDCHLAWTRSS
jgi:hypothetical protein